ncbi:MAG: hypothetical protein NVV82_18030 [Sporocytophaga sp.]|nr:hypothetical protein [Sporocytophaga sp.]
MLAPFLVLDDLTFTIENVGSYNESIVLKFDNSHYQIDCRLDRLIFIYEGSGDTLQNSNGPIKLFMNVLEAYKKLDTFGKIKNILIAHTAINVLEKDPKEILVDFKNKYLNKAVLNFVDSEDIAIILERGNEDYHIKVDFGIYSPKDFVKHSISRFNSEYNLQFKDKFGVMAVCQISEKTKECDFDKFKVIFKESLKIIQKIGYGE